MTAAFATWNGRIAPVFDVTRHLHLVEREGTEIIRQNQVALRDETPAQLALALLGWKVQVLICGAISNPLRAMLEAYGIEVIPFVAGELGEVIEAWRQGSLLRQNRFAMPGCCRGIGRHGQGRYPQSKEATMFGFGRGGNRGAGGGQGAGGGRGAGGGGRMGGKKAAGPTGECLCPACGHREAHERSVPCTQKMCPKCGAAMTRA